MPTTTANTQLTMSGSRYCRHGSEGCRALKSHWPVRTVAEACDLLCADTMSLQKGTELKLSRSTALHWTWEQPALHPEAWCTSGFWGPSLPGMPLLPKLVSLKLPVCPSLCSSHLNVLFCNAPQVSAASCFVPCHVQGWRGCDFLLAAGAQPGLCQHTGGLPATV